LRVGCPIRRSRDQRLLASPPGLSQRATPFIASQCQGIHQMPLRRSIHGNARASPYKTRHSQGQKPLPQATLLHEDTLPHKADEQLAAVSHKLSAKNRDTRLGHTLFTCQRTLSPAITGDNLVLPRSFRRSSGLGPLAFVTRLARHCRGYPCTP
jgi:hypothetical protein